MRHVLFAFALLAAAAPIPAAADGALTVRTERFPRPPYSGATYYIYEQGGRVICTKLSVCNKYDRCTTTYARGPHKDPQDVETGAPYGATPAAAIPAGKRSKHVCLTKFGLR